MRVVGILFIALFSLQVVVAQNLKPYVLAIKSTESVATLKEKVKASLEENGLSVIGQYKPADDNNRWILVVSSPDLDRAVEQVGGLTGFAAALRVAITKEGSETIVSYTNPKYWGNAYFRDSFTKVANNYIAFSNKLIKSMKSVGEFKGTTFGSEEGLSVKDLRKYHYMMGMPYFDDTVELEEFESYSAAIEKVEANIAKGVPNVKLVYKHKVPGKNITLYGFALSGEKGEGKFMPIIDIGKPKHTAFLPYEILIVDNKVHMLNGRFRIALSFPDLTMGTFTKIMSTPGDIEDLMEQLVK